MIFNFFRGRNKFSFSNSNLSLQFSGQKKMTEQIIKQKQKIGKKTKLLTEQNTGKAKRPNLALLSWAAMTFLSFKLKKKARILHELFDIYNFTWQNKGNV